MVNLQSMSIWLVWRYEHVKGKKTKVPYGARSRAKIGADKKYRPQWVSFDEAADAYRANGYSGMGFVIPEGYAVIDLDHASEDFIREIERLVDTYTEVSPSGDGRHIIARVRLNEIPQKDGRLDGQYYMKNSKIGAEVYIGGLTNRYMTYTGNAEKKLPIKDCTEGILKFLEKYMKRDNFQTQVTAGTKVTAFNETKAADVQPDQQKEILDDLDLICLARKAKNSEKFIKLYDNGDVSDYGSHSEADLALCNMLAFYSQGDAETIDRLYRSSALYRDKWERQDYRDMTIEKSVALCMGNYYTGKSDKPGFVFVDEKGRRHVSCPLLAKHFREHQYLLSVRDSGRGGVQRYVYEDGCYKPYADEMIKGVIKGYITEYDEALLHMRDVNEVFQQLITDLHFVNSDSINADENLINFKNGLLDVNKMELLPHSPEVLSTIQLPCEWTGKEVPTPVFDSFIGTLTDGDKDIEELLLEYIGVCISNVKGWRMKKALFMVGPGDTGKSQLKSLTEQLLGKGNYVAIDLGEIEARFGTGNIYGKRLAGSSDMSFMTVDELKTFKKCTGGDSLFAEFKGQNGFEFVYNGLLWFCMNRLPRFGGDDGDWVYNRIIQVECKNVVPLEQQDKRLLDKLYAEREGIIYKAVMALKRVIADGYVFREPEAVKQARKKYHDENNTVIAFFNDCMIERPDGKVKDGCTTGKVYKVYQEWCRDNNHGFAKTAKEFRDELSVHVGSDYQSMIVRRGKGGSFFKLYTLSDEAKSNYQKAYGYEDFSDVEPLLGA